MTQGIDRAVEVLRHGGLVAFPTETVYGLGADASNELAVRRIFAAKGRPADHPLIVHIASPDDLDGWADHPNDTARRLARALWPGPLTLLVRRTPRVLDAVTGGRDTVGLRVPSHPVAHELLNAFGGGVAAPSANRFGAVSPTTADHVRRDLGSAVDFILDGGPCTVGVESTIIDCSGDVPQVLRPGGVPVEQIEDLLHGRVAGAHGPSRAPGMLASHYAPRCRVTPVDGFDAARAAVGAAEHAARRVELIDFSGDPAHAARNLYGLLRDADDRGLDEVVVVQPRPDGLGLAVRDRLAKAAAAR